MVGAGRLEKAEAAAAAQAMENFETELQMHAEAARAEGSEGDEDQKNDQGDEGHEFGQPDFNDAGEYDSGFLSGGDEDNQPALENYNRSDRLAPEVAASVPYNFTRPARMGNCGRRPRTPNRDAVNQQTSSRGGRRRGKRAQGSESYDDRQDARGVKVQSWSDDALEFWTGEAGESSVNLASNFVPNLNELLGRGRSIGGWENLNGPTVTRAGVGIMELDSAGVLGLHLLSA